MWLVDPAGSARLLSGARCRIAAVPRKGLTGRRPTRIATGPEEWHHRTGDATVAGGDSAATPATPAAPVPFETDGDVEGDRVGDGVGDGDVEGEGDGDDEGVVVPAGCEPSVGTDGGMDVPGTAGPVEVTVGTAGDDAEACPPAGTGAG